MHIKLCETNKMAACSLERWSQVKCNLHGRTISPASDATQQIRCRHWHSGRSSSQSSRELPSTSNMMNNNNESNSIRRLQGNLIANLALPNYYHYNGNKELLCCLLVPLMLIIASIFPATPIVSMVECTQTSTTYAEPISWSFGGWAPVDGKPIANRSTSTDPHSSSQPMPTTPYNRAPIIHPRPQERAYHQPEQAPFRMPPLLKPGVGDQQFLHHRASLGPSSYSPRAPVPIMRNHPLAAGPAQWPMMRGPNDGHPKQMMPSYARPQHVPAAYHFEQQHQQHMRQHQHRIQQIHANHPPQFNGPAEGPKMYAPYQFKAWQQQPPVQQQHRRPIQSQGMHQPNMANNLLHKNRQEPILYMRPQHQLSMQGDRIPVLEVSVHENGNGSLAQQAPQRYSEPVQLPHDPPMASSNSAIEKDMNYRSALSKVEAGEIHLPANSIHDIKQQQEKLERQLNKNSYLTIPVAVETDGDRVLTADDISEIEKHVINVLPNLKTADKIAKIADAHVATVGGNQSSAYVQITPVVEVVDAPAPTTIGYHRPQQQEQQKTTTALRPDNGGRHYSTGTANTQAPYHSSSASISSSSYSDETSPSTGPGLTEPTHYLVVSEPAHEVGILGELSDLNLKNDLLHQFRYEPTRAHPQAKQHQPQNQQQQQHFNQLKASTPPMSHHTAHSLRPRNRANQLQGRQANQQRYTTSTTSSTTSTTNGRDGSPSSSTRTIMGGQKVSDVMRLLIRTTPVPMTSPMHVPSLEPERVDAIQLIAGGPHEQKPMVVEAHELVNHTPDGGFDLSSGRTRAGSLRGQPEQQQQQQQSSNHSANHYEVQMVSQPEQHSQQSNQERENHQQGAIIEYVSINEPHTLEQAYEVSGRPEVYMEPAALEPPSSNHLKQLPYEAPLSVNQEAHQHHNEQHQQHPQQYQGTGGSSQPATDTNSAHAAWSPSIASEHQQHLELLSEHANRQLDLPATAGYNFFTSQPEPQVQQQQQPQENSQEQQQQQQQQQQLQQLQHEHQEEEQQSSTKSLHHKDSWPRSKAGGRQPNPDAQYDGQILKADGQQLDQDLLSQQIDDHNNNNSLQGHTSPPFASTYNTAAAEEHLLQPTTSSLDQLDHFSSQNSSTEDYQQPAVEEEQQQQVEGHSTRSLVGGAQLNHATPSQVEQQSYGEAKELGYTRLDRNKQQGHLRRHQQQHQAHRAHLLQQQQRPLNYSEPGPGEDKAGEETLVDAAAGQGEESEPSVGDKEQLASYQEQPPSGDLQSLLADSNQDHDTNELFSDDDKAKASKRAREPVYQVYQAYYAPKHHKPLPGYVRLSVREFNELFKDAEIKYVHTNNATTASASSASLASLAGAHL